MRYLGLILVILVALTSCDSREDWFDRNDMGPDIEFTLNGVTDTISKGDKRVIEINLYPTIMKDHWISSDTVHLIVKGISDEYQLPLQEIIIDDMKMSMNTNFFESNEKNEVDVTLYHRYYLSDYDTFFDNDTTVKLLETFNQSLVVIDGFDKQTNYTIKVNIWSLVPPTPVLTVSKLSDEGEYNFSLEKSYDRDGKVEKYEWCIDGNVVPYTFKDKRFDWNKGVWQSGNAAYGGKYVKATTISSVNHAFQESGEHIIYYRCMDDMGVWSMWYSEKINVE